MQVLREKFFPFIDRLSWGAGVAAAGAIFVMMVIVAYEVVVRYLLHRPTIWTVEIAAYLLIFSSLLAATYTLWQRGHVSVELLYRRLPPKARLVLSLVNSFLALIFTAVFVWQGWLMTLKSWTAGWEHWGMLGVPLWTTEILVPISGVLLGLQLWRQLFDFYLELREGKEGGS